MSQQRHVWLAVPVVAALASLYPLAAGRTLVSPLLGGNGMLYGAPPFLPGLPDAPVEWLRGSDPFALPTQQQPYSLIARDALARGEWPLWNRHHAIGAPLWGQGQTMMLDPLHWMVLLAPDASRGWDAKFAAARVIFAVGIARLVADATGSRVAAMGIGAAAPFAGVFLFRLTHPAQFVLPYAPWLLVTLGRLVHARSPVSRARLGVAAAILAALLFVGSPPKEAVTMLAACATATVVLAARSEHAAMLATWASLAAAAATALLLAAPHWLIFLQALGSAFTIYDTPDLDFATFRHAAAFVLGPFKPGDLLPGMNPLIAALAGVALLRPRALAANHYVLGAAVTAALLLVIAFGLTGRAWILGTPFLRNIHQIDFALLTVATPFVLVMAGQGVQALAALPARARRAIAIPVAISAALCAFAGAVHVPLGGRLDHLVVNLPPAAAVVPSPALEAARAIVSSPVRAIGVAGAFAPGTQRYFGLEGLDHLDALQAGAFVELARTLRPEWSGVPWEGLYQEADLERLARWFDFLNVGLVVYPPVSAGRDVRVSVRPTAWPRLFFSDRVEPYDTIQQLADRINTASGPFAAMHRSESAPRAFNGSGAVVAATHYQLTPNTTAATIDTPGPGLVVLAEGWLPDDFVATLNGERVPYARVNHVYKAVSIPRAGRWRVRFDYRPRVWAISWWLAAAGAGAAALWILAAAQVTASGAVPGSKFKVQTQNSINTPADGNSGNSFS